MASGYIKLHRAIQDNPKWLAEAFSRQQAWIDLLLLANHKPTVVYIAGHRIDVQRGEVAWSAVNLANRWRWSKSKFWRFMDELERDGQTTHRNAVLTTVISITNYDMYQSCDTPNESPQFSRDTPNESPQQTQIESPKTDHKQADTNTLQYPSLTNDTPNESPQCAINESPKHLLTPSSPSFPSRLPPVSPSLSPCIPSYIPSYSPSSLPNASSSPTAECQTFQLVSEELHQTKPMWSPACGWSGIQTEDMKAWELAYPACDIKRELAKMDEWLRSNPRLAVKKLYRRFINNWLSRHQERGGDRGYQLQNKTISRGNYGAPAAIRESKPDDGWWRKHIQPLYSDHPDKVSEFLSVRGFGQLPPYVQDDCTKAEELLKLYPDDLNY